MALPKLKTPTHMLELPSTGEKIKFRPFLVKEQKLLMMAQESGNEDELASVMSELIAECTFNAIDAETAPMFDVEYIFLQVRGKSVGETIELNVLCDDDGKTRVPVSLNIEDIFITVDDKHTNEINITNDVKLTFRYPILADMKNLIGTKSNTALMYKLLSKCIQKIEYGDETYEKADMTEKDIDDFIDSLTSEQFQKLIEFFETMPKLRHVIKITNPKTKKKNEVVLEGLQSFLE